MSAASFPITAVASDGLASDAGLYVREDSPHFTKLALFQVTIPRNDDGSYDNVLNERGERLLRETLVRVESGSAFRDTLSDYRLQRCNSGSCCGDDPSEPMVLNSWHNLAIVGTTSSGTSVQTSIVVLANFSHADDPDECDGWALTKSGSLYRLVRRAHNMVV